MRVAQFSEFGGPQALRLEQVTEPSPGPADVLIKVTAVGLNFFDTLMLRNQYQVTPPLPVLARSGSRRQHRSPWRRGRRSPVGAKGRRLYRRQWLP